MKPESKLILRGIPFLILGFLFLVWGLYDILSLTGGTLDLLSTIIIIVFAVMLLILGVIIIVGLILRQRHVLYKKDYKCRECGAAINLEEEYCAECGAKNVAKYEALEKLEEYERKIEKVKAKRAKAKPPKTRRNKKLEEIEDEMLANREREMRVKKTKLIIGGSHEGKLEWIKTQYYDLNRSIQDIADDLNESMMTIRKYLDEIDNQGLTNDEKKYQSS